MKITLKTFPAGLETIEELDLQEKTIKIKILKGEPELLGEWWEWLDKNEMAVLKKISETEFQGTITDGFMWFLNGYLNKIELSKEYLINWLTEAKKLGIEKIIMSGGCYAANDYTAINLQSEKACRAASNFLIDKHRGADGIENIADFIIDNYEDKLWLCDEHPAYWTNSNLPTLQIIAQAYSKRIKEVEGNERK